MSRLDVTVKDGIITMGFDVNVKLKGKGQEKTKCPINVNLDKTRTRMMINKLERALMEVGQ